MPFQMAPLGDHEEDGVRRDPQVDPFLDLRSRILGCASEYSDAPVGDVAPEDHELLKFPGGNEAFCRAWVRRWIRALEGTSRFPASGDDAHRQNVEQQATAITEDVLGFDPRITGARVARDQFLSMFRGTASVEEVVASLARERVRLGDDRADMHAYFAMLAYRVGVDLGGGSEYDESLDGFLAAGEQELTPTADEVGLFVRLHRTCEGLDIMEFDRWLDAGYSQEAQRRARRRQNAPMGNLVPRFPGMVESAMQPENHDYAATTVALGAYMTAGVPVLRDAGFRRDWAEKLAWLAELATNPDRVWRERGYREGLLPRLWMWFSVAGEAGKRKRFCELVEFALAELEHELDLQREPGFPLAAPVVSALASPLPVESPANGVSVNSFVLLGEMWQVSFAGTTVNLSNRKGMTYLGILLGRPNERIPIEDLAGVPNTAREPKSTDQPILDLEAASKIRQSLDDLEDELDRAIEDNDIGRQESLAIEHEQLLAQLNASAGLKGRARSFAAARDGLRARVGGAILHVLRIIDTQHPALGRHLRASLENPTGVSPCYRPPAGMGAFMIKI